MDNIVKGLIENRIKIVARSIDTCMESIERCERKGDIISLANYTGCVESWAAELVFLKSLTI